VARLSISLLGSIKVTLDGQAVTRFESDRVLALLIYLVVEADHPQRREVLAGLLWPDHAERAARHNLSQALLRLRQSIGDREADPPFLLITRQTLQFNRDSDYWLDVALLQTASKALSSSGQEQEISPVDAADMEALRQAATLYRGDFLDQLTLADSDLFENWTITRREQYRQGAAHLLDFLAGYYTERAEYESAHHYLRQQLSLDPLYEEAHRMLMRLLALSGQRSAALAQYATCRRLLAEELGVTPAAETVALYEEIRAGQLDQAVSRPGERAAGEPAPAPSGAVSVPSDPYATLSRLEPLPDQRLFGVEAARAKLDQMIRVEGRPWLVAIDGIGGIGKTSLAHDLVHSLLSSGRFHDIAWVSAKQEEFLPEVGLQATGRPALDVETLTDALLEQLDHPAGLSSSPQEKRVALTRLLKERPHLVIVDNLETVTDHQVLLPYLRHLANPSKFLLTTRYSLKAQADVYALSLTELSQADTLAFLAHEANVRGIGPLSQASATQLERIYAVVGGNPLALKLVTGQVSFLPLAQVLENLRQMQGKKTDELYTYIYWQAWRMLDAAGRQLFLSMPVIPNGTFAQLATASELEPETLQTALAQLVALSLVQVGGTLEEPRYFLHRLTETFLMQEILEWQPSP